MGTGVMGGLLMPEHKRRAFARKYIERRLSEGREDAIEELSAYLADWLTLRQTIQDLAAIMGKDHSPPAKADVPDSR